MFFNRETRDSLDPMERSYLNKTYTYLGTGLALTAGMAVALHRSGLSVRVMTANPWLVLGVGLVGSIGGMIGTRECLSSSPSSLFYISSTSCTSTRPN